MDLVRRFFYLTAVIVAGIGLAAGQAHEHGSHGTEAAMKSQTIPQDPSLPASEENAREALNSSPRHGEWADVPVWGTNEKLRTWVVYPERKDKAPVVILICEIYGLSDWIRAVADRLAADGFIAVAPDMVWGKGPGGSGTESATSRDQVVGWIRGLTNDEVLTRLNAARSYGISLPAANGKSATIGFCWGGSQSFTYACVQPGLNAAVVYYGSSPDSSRLAQIKATPVLGLYGADDARVNATIEPAQRMMKQAEKTYEVEIFEGAGHGFLRAQAGREGANHKATQKAWPRTIEFLRKHTR
ncbi:MAG: dienelactone hydrolase family protein [Bacteroidota bacterium]